MFLVADHDDLFATRYRAERIHRLHLTGFIDEKQIEFDGARMKELGHRNGAHHEHWLNGLNAAARLGEQLTQGQMAAFFAHLLSEDAHLTSVALVNRQASRMRLADLVLRHAQSLAI
ncbi:MAG: hypothetical protein ABI548_18235 [Polyangiaceae bacterium]